jgi:hypothetical protein
MLVWPSMPGFVCAINGHPIEEGWTRVYQLLYFVGLVSTPRCATEKASGH